MTSIGEYAFQNCTGLNKITSLATTAPAIQSNTFMNVKSDGTLYVPAGATGYDTWSSNYYFSDWTMQTISE